MTRLEQLREFLAAEPGDAFLRYAIAQELMGQGAYGDALADLEALAADEPDYLPVWYALGKLQLELGKQAAAVAALEQGIRVAEAQGNRKTLGELRMLLEEAD